MDIIEKFTIFKKYMLDKYDNIPNEGCLYFGNDDIVIVTTKFPLWEELTDKNCNDTLCHYFMEVIREELPELKGIRIRFKTDIIGHNYNKFNI